jgi:hypothetical protein
MHDRARAIESPALVVDEFDGRKRDQPMKRRREITLETEKIVIRGDLFEFKRCDACTASTPTVTVEQAAMLIGEEVEHLYRRIECGQVHSTRTARGSLMICLKSLSTVPGSEWQVACLPTSLELIRQWQEEKND